MEFRILGPLEVSDEGHSLPLGGPKQRLVLTHLLARANRVVSRDDLIDAIWGDAPPPAARSSLAAYVSRLRRILGPGRIESRSGGYVLHATDREVDALVFDTFVEEARRRAVTDAAAAVRAYECALALWRGGALDDLAAEPSLRPEIARLEEQRMVAIEERITVDLALGSHAELVPELEALVGAHPLRERLWAHLVVALYRSGRQGEALAAYQRARASLLDELGIEPSRELQRLQEQVLLQDDALEAVGRPLRGYRLLEELGAGSFGSVHRALQPQVGREVAIKVVHPDLADTPEFIRRFETEARLIARLEHPNIVPLYDYWREPAGAYLVMRYLRGGSLGDRLADGPLSVEQGADVIDQVAMALSVAHRQGVVHRDIKPANILFDEEANAYVTDFGVARDLATSHVTDGVQTASPVAYYLSPEEIRGEPVTAATDVYGLGLLVYEALTGRHPLADTPFEEVLDERLHYRLPSLRACAPHLPPGLEDVVQRATAKDPAARFVDATEFAAALRGALARSTAAPDVPSTTEARNPYRGLRPFSEPDASDFFGRESLIERLVSRVERGRVGSHFLAVVGPSGSGKSSVVHAGLIPALRAGALPGSEEWFYVDMVPSSQPFEELSASLARVALDPIGDLGARLVGEGSLVQIAEEILPEDAQVMLVVDQFEEIFTLVEDEDVRAAFLGALVSAVTDPRSRIRVVVTLRADFYDRPLAYKGFGDLVAARTEAVTPLSPEELERAIAGPAQRVGVVVDPSLVADIVADVTAQPGALPLLEYALTELFDKRKDSVLTPNAYREIGGVSGALARRAEDLYARFDQDGKHATRQLLLRLVAVGEEASEDTRRRVTRAELGSLEQVKSEALNAAIETLGALRLLSFDRDPVTRGPTVEVAHEALLREWSRLRGWIEAARDDVKMRARLSAGAREWAESGQDPSFVLRGGHLVRFEGWAATSGLALTAEEHGFLEASLAQREVDRADEQARADRERGLERSSLVRLRALVAMFAILALVATGLTALTIDQRQRAERATRAATARELAAAAIVNLDVDAERSILLALEAVDVTRSTDDLVLREAEEALHRAVKSSRLVGTIGQGGWGLAVTSDGTKVITTGSDQGDNTAVVRHIETGAEAMRITGPEVGRLSAPAVSRDDRLIATSHNDGTVRLWDAANGEELRVLRVKGAFGHPALSADGRRVAIGAKDGTVRVLNVATGAEVMTLKGHTDAVVSTAFSPDDSRLVSAGWDRSPRIWNLDTGMAVATLVGHEWPVPRVAFSPDGARVATAGEDATARIWDVETGARLMTLSAPTQILAVAFSPDGSRMAAGGGDGATRVWDTESGRAMFTLPGHSAEVVNVAFTPDGERLLTASLDDTTRVWDVSAAGARDWLAVPGVTGIFPGVAFSPDGRMFAAPADPSGVTLWDTTTGEEIRTLTGHEPKLTTVAFSPDGRRLVAGSDLTFDPPVWDVRTGELLYTLTGHDSDVRAVAFSPDGHRLVTGSDDGSVRVWDARSGSEIHRVAPGAGPQWAVSFTPDGRFLVAGGHGGDVRLWDAETFDEAGVLQGHRGHVFGIASGPDGTLASAGLDGTARLWDVESRSEKATLRGHDAPVNQVAISPDGSRVATAGEDGTARLWNPETGRQVLTLFEEDALFDVAFSPDGRLLATAGANGTVVLHLLPIDEFVEVARERVTRTLTGEECHQYLRAEECPDPRAS